MGDPGGDSSREGQKAGQCGWSQAWEETKPRSREGRDEGREATVRSLDCVISTVLSRGVTQSTYFSKTSVHSMETDCRRRAEGWGPGTRPGGKQRRHGQDAGNRTAGGHDVFCS